MKTGYLVIQSGPIFQGEWQGGESRAGEIVFNTAHAGYEEIATDPSYFSQIIVMTAPMMGNYGTEPSRYESKTYWIEGFVCLEIQKSARNRGWLEHLTRAGVPVLSGLDTRKLVLYLRQNGTPWGAVVQADSEEEARELADRLIAEKAKLEKDWVHLASRRKTEVRPGQNPNGPRVAVLDYGSKENILRNLAARSREIAVFPSRTGPEEILAWKPDGIVLTNGPGDPAEVEGAVETVRELLGQRYIFGICMGHQILARALGAKTYKLRFGHRGANHPVRDLLLNQIYVTSQNHGYAVDEASLPEGVRITHTNLNDGTVQGIECRERQCMSVQFHPESHPGPNDAAPLFDYFVKRIT